MIKTQPRPNHYVIAAAVILVLSALTAILEPWTTDIAIPTFALALLFLLCAWASPKTGRTRRRIRRTSIALTALLALLWLPMLAGTFVYLGTNLWARFGDGEIRVVIGDNQAIAISSIDPRLPPVPNLGAGWTFKSAGGLRAVPDVAWGALKHLVPYRLPHRLTGARGRGIMIEIPITMLLLATALFTLWVYLYNPRKLPPGHCPKCRYNLTGNTSNRCPECGFLVADPSNLTWPPI